MKLYKPWIQKLVKSMMANLSETNQNVHESLAKASVTEKSRNRQISL